MSFVKERVLFGGLIDIDGTLTELGSVSWLDFTQQMWLMEGCEMPFALEKRDRHEKIFHNFRMEMKSLNNKEEKLARIEKLNNDLFEQVWNTKKLVLNRKNVEKISRAVLAFRLRPEGDRFLRFLEVLVRDLKIPIFVLTAAHSVLAEVIAKDYKLTGGKASSNMIFSNGGKWKGFSLDADLNRSKVRHTLQLQSEEKLPRRNDQIFVVGDGPTEIEMVEYYPNNVIISKDIYEKDDRVSSYASNLDEVMMLMYDQLGEEGEKLVLPEDLDKLLRTRSNT